jgi:hypothetical protein
MAIKTAPSLKPGPKLIFRCVLGDPTAKRIRDSWKFNFPISRVKTSDFAKLSENSWGVAW